MKPAPFEYHAPAEVDDALALLAEHGDDARPLAGGQSLVPILALRLTQYEHIVDLNRVAALSHVGRSDGHVEVGAMTRQAAAERDGTIARDLPLLRDAIGLIGHFQTRNRGTVGGSLAHADPTSELAASALALDAELDVASASGKRTVAADDWLDSAYTTTIAPDELLVTIRYPVPAPRCGHAIREIARRHGDFAIAGATALVTLGDDGTVAHARAVLFAVSERARRVPAVEQALIGARPDAFDLESIAELARDDLDPIEDLQGTATYRRSVAGTLMQDVVSRAMSRAQESHV